MTGYEKVVAALAAHSIILSGWGTVKMATCPVHDDSKPSMSVTESDDGKALLYCHAGCSIEAIVEALGLTMSDLFADGDEAAIYTYTDEEDRPLFRVHRGRDKTFWQEHLEDGEWKKGLGDTRRVLYRLSDLSTALHIWIVEGEKDVETLRAQGSHFVATTTPGGAGKWRDEYTEMLPSDAVVWIIADDDEPGRISAQKIRVAIEPHVNNVEVYLPAATCKDMTRHFMAGYGVSDIRRFDDVVTLAEFDPVDWEAYVPQKTEWLWEPYLPKGGRVLAFGAAGSRKSLWAMWLAARLSQEGHRVAYFSLEMPPSMTVRRLKQSNPDKKNFLLFTNLAMGNPAHLAVATAGLKDCELIVVDSWTAARSEGNSNDEVARLDNEFFQPLIEKTGATLLILDNVGHPAFASDGSTMQPDWARGASAKQDKMEVCLMFSRPSHTNNYRTTVSFKKMRLDYPMPHPVTIETPRDRIEFYTVEQGMMTDIPVWEGLRVEVEPELEETNVLSSEIESLAEQLAFARLRDRLGGVEWSDETRKDSSPGETTSPARSGENDDDNNQTL